MAKMNHHIANIKSGQSSNFHDFDFCPDFLYLNILPKAHTYSLQSISYDQKVSDKNN